MENPVEVQCTAVLASPCAYTTPPYHFVNGHNFCPCICKAIRTAYIGGFLDGKEGREPEVGIDSGETK